MGDASSLIEDQPKLQGYFQRILVDAPCSGLGTLARNPDARWRMNPEKIKELILLQEKLLRGVLPLLCPGGRIVYSTCTVNPEENLYQIQRFVKSIPNLKLIHEKQIWPDEDKLGDGFFAAVMDFL